MGVSRSTANKMNWAIFFKKKKKKREGGGDGGEAAAGKLKKSSETEANKEVSEVLRLLGFWRCHG